MNTSSLLLSYRLPLLFTYRCYFRAIYKSFSILGAFAKLRKSTNMFVMKDWGESVSELMIEKKTITRNCTQYCLTWVFLPFVHVKF